MAFSKVFSSLPSTSNPVDQNVTASITQLPANILEAFIPGYSIISRFLLEVLGFDITVAVSVCFLLFGLFTSVRFLWDQAYSNFEKHFTSFISIESDDDLYEQVMDWVGQQSVSTNAKSLNAKTGHAGWDEDVSNDAASDPTQDGIYLNFSNWDSKVPPKYQPYFGTHKFRFQGRYFELSRQPKQMASAGWGGTVFREEETLRLTCIGRSTKPLKHLISECQAHYFAKQSSKTVVRRPATKEVRNRGRYPWIKVATRPSRPMDTVVLEHDQKDLVLKDINEYLHPASSRWYANRGIPYRRGYLFHGPPGTGKTSLSFAIAGIFGIDIYCISLLEPTLTEEDLGVLFNNLPRRCVVLLEDIDSAGLIRQDESEEQKNDATNIEKESETQISHEIAKAFKSVQKKNEKDKNQGISLSGLLNAIDGVASHEGRVLVMTTNYPEKLDEALVRPGRVDMKVAFTMASESQIRELFARMYSAATFKTPSKLPGSIMNGKPKTGVKFTNGGLKSSTKINGTIKVSSNGIPEKGASISADELSGIAAQFAALLPESTFSPAEIQGFLLTRKKEPRRALAEVTDWRDKLLEAKAAKSKLAPA
ncbi:hypothetical protein MMC14_010604 [Varicellaria rhodocarpa]|nr:hypothetical protein [Varicellaria rhodocarpa]